MITTEYNVVVQFDFLTDALTTATRLASFSGFTTFPGDTPQNTHVFGRIKKIGPYTQEVFSSSRTTGLVKPATGEIVLYNTDGILDSWISLGTAGCTVTVSIGLKDNPYPSGYYTVFIAHVLNVVGDFDELRFRLRDRSYLLDKPVVVDTFRGTGGLEGPTGFSQKKPLLILSPGYIPVILLDSVKQIYFVMANASDDLAVAGTTGQVYEGGRLITRGSNYSSETELLYTEPSAGTVRFYFGATSGGHALGPIYFRLAAPPIFDLRAYFTGYVFDPTDAAYASAPGIWTMTAMCRRAGFKDVTAAAMAPGAANDLYIAAQYIGDDRTYLDVLQSTAFETQSFFGFNRNDKFFCAPLGSPSALESGETYAAYFTLDNTNTVRRGYLNGMEGPMWQVTVSSGETWPSNLTTGVDSVIKEAMTRSPWQGSFSGTSDSLRFRYQNATSMVLETKALVNYVSVISNMFELYGEHRDLLTFNIPFTVEMMEALYLNAPVWITMNRFGCESGRHFRICVLTIDMTERLITLGVWGGIAGTTSWVYGGGTTYSSGGGGGIGGAVTGISANAPASTLTVNSSVVPGGAVKVYTATASLIPGSATGGSGSSVILLMKMEGTNGGTTFSDTSSLARTVAHKHPAGTLTITTSSTQKKFGSTSAHFANSAVDDQLQIARGSAGADYLPADFTVEGFLYLVDDPTDPLLQGQYTLWFVEGYSPSNVLTLNSGAVYIDGASIGELCFDFDTSLSGVPAIAGGSAVTRNTWHHWALERVGTTIRLSLDGTSIGTTTSSRIIGRLEAGSTIESEGLSDQGLMGGFPELYQDNLRITRGAAVYGGASSFTPPSSDF